MPDPVPNHAIIARLQHVRSAKHAAVRLEHYAQQVLEDLCCDRPSIVNGHQVAGIAVELCGQLVAIAAIDEMMARLAAEAAA